jgi:hypothetical protein
LNLSVTFTAIFNRGSINGKMNGSWNPSGFQNYRAGTSISYDIRGITQSSNSITVALAVSPGENLFSAFVLHNEGPQPLDSDGNPFSTPLPSGYILNSPSRSIMGYRAYFYGTDLTSVDSASIRMLSKSLNPVNNTQFTINIPANTTNVCFAYPASLRDVSSVIYVEGMNSEIKSVFGSPQIVPVNGDNDYQPIDYKVYLMIPDEPFPSSATYIVKI